MNHIWKGNDHRCLHEDHLLWLFADRTVHSRLHRFIYSLCQQVIKLKRNDKPVCCAVIWSTRGQANWVTDD